MAIVLNNYNLELEDQRKLYIELKNKFKLVQTPEYKKEWYLNNKNKIWYCVDCEKDINYWSKSQHLQTKFHKKIHEIKNMQGAFMLSAARK